MSSERGESSMSVTQATERELNIGDEVQGICSAWFDEGRGYGFIRVTGVAKDVFVPARNLVDSISLHVGQRVSFEVRLDREGRLFADGVAIVGVRVS